MNTCRADEWKLCRTYLEPFLSFFQIFFSCFEGKQEAEEIFPTFKTKEGAKYLERLVFRCLRAKKDNQEIKKNDPKTVWKYSTSSASIRMALIDY